MRKPRWELADIVRRYAPDFEANPALSRTQKRVLRDIVTCRTAAKGGHIDRCDRCGHETISYNSCRNRHCPKCQGVLQSQWLAAREQEILPVEYFHVIFSMPKEIARIAFQNKKVVYDLLFRAVRETLREAAADPSHLGAQIGGILILHTWGQNLEHHPHVHCVIPGGGISPDGSSWIPCRKGFFLPVRLLSRLFRGKFLHHLKAAYTQKNLSFWGEIDFLGDLEAFQAYLSPLYKKDWFVFCRPPFGSSSQVLKYLSRYTHRVAISNYRIADISKGNVTFFWRDYAHGCRRRVLTLTASEFIRRFLLHVLPKGLVRIRHFGFLANRTRQNKIALCRSLLGVRPPESPDLLHEEIAPCRICPHCKKGTMIMVSSFSPCLSSAAATPGIDSS
jgi:hypothetical protein